MSRVSIITIASFSLSLASTQATQTPAKPFEGLKAFAFTRKATSFGERPSGSEALARTRDWIVSELKPLGAQVSLDRFDGQTPAGPVPMANILVKFGGVSGKVIAVTGHYDTKKIPMVRFVGANDGGSSTGFLLEFARAVSKSKYRDDIVIVFFDGEEALGEWSETDSRYGSRHLAAKWLADGTLPRLKALINVDMIADKDLDLSNDANSSESLRASVRQIAERLKYSKYFRTEASGIDDDHKPFADLGANVLDIIDLDYGPGGGYWHTAKDTTDKLSTGSMQVVGDVVTELIRKLDSEP